MTFSNRTNPLPVVQGLHADAIVPYYQPIIALETRRIEGYEVLGRAIEKGAVRSLGPFFGDSSVPMEDQLRVDRYIRGQAIARISREANPPLLFLNLKPEWIYTYGQEGELRTLAMLKELGVDPGRVVLEITEESFIGSVDILRAVIDRYRESGCRIAIDDVGSGFSSADRIAQIQPNLLKIDMHMVKKSATHNGYYGVLRSFSELAEQIGASLLFEGVETREDLERAIQSGARYVQGFLFAKAEPDLMEPGRFAPFVEAELERHLKQYAMTERCWQDRAARLAGQLQAGLREPDGPEPDAWLQRLLPHLDGSCLRVYLCNEDGIQLSANYRRSTEGEWLREEQFRHANWSWRPYFVPNLVHLNERRRSIVSRAYTDLETREWIRTISVLVHPGLILFVDSQDTVKAGTRADSGAAQ